VKYTVLLGGAEFVAEMRTLLRGDRDEQTGFRRASGKTLGWTEIVRASHPKSTVALILLFTAPNP
jgi:hypothetical protein